jgi:hypothetical protein
MARIFALGLSLFALLTPALAQQKIDVQRMTRAETASAYRTYAIMLAAFMNCESVRLREKDGDRIANFGTVLNEKLDASIYERERRFYGPAFSAVNGDNNRFCKRFAPQVAGYARRIP